jgi:hypothetical protein
MSIALMLSSFLRPEALALHHFTIPIPRGQGLFLERAT